MQPRVIRLKDASKYLGMDKNRFDKEVRPQLTEFSIGKMGIGFDRVDLDAWFDHYKQRNGRPAVRSNKPWDKISRPASTYAKASGTLTSITSKSEFAKVRELATSKRRSST